MPTTPARLACASICLLLAACSPSPLEIPAYNVSLICRYETDPLYTLVDSVSVEISAENPGTLGDTSFAVELSPSGTLIIGLKVTPGPGRLFEVQFKDLQSRVLYSSDTRRDVPAGSYHSFDLFFRQSGFATASSVIVFRDALPWDSNALDSAMTGMGLSIGAGEYCYNIYSSSEMGSSEMRPGADLVIISNDQPQEFYNNYSAASEMFERFAADGGTLLWCACDMGWNYGSITDAGVLLPGSVSLNYRLDPINVIAGRSFELLAGFPDTLRGNYASQEVFSDLPTGAIVYTTDLEGSPSLVGFRYGRGWVFISGQPLEYNYDRREDYNIGELLPRLIRFILGISPAEAVFLYPGKGTSSVFRG